MSVINKDILDQVSERESIILKEQNDKNKEFIKSILYSILDCCDEVNDILDTFNYMRDKGLIDIIPDHIYYAKSKTSLYCPYFIKDGGYHKFIYSQNCICRGSLSYHDVKIEIIYIPKSGELIINYDYIFKTTIHIKSIYKYNNDVKFECDLNRNKYTLMDDNFIRSLNDFKINFKQMLNEMKNKLNNIK
jgi:hypothetical protein